MNITVNGIPHTVTPNISLQELLEVLGLRDHTGMAIAKNRTLIRRKDWAGTSLEEDDEIEMMTAASLANEANMDVAGTTTPASTGSESVDYGSDDVVED